jgi:predicted ATPase
VTGVVSSLPTQGVTFLLTDIEGSTRAWQAAPDAMTAPVSRHYEILDAAIAAHHGRRPEEQGEGDSVVAVFLTATDAVAAALEAQLTLLRELPDLPVRMALHSGDAMLRNEHNYVGLTIIRCARIRACGHGRQILLSDDTARDVDGTLPPGAGVADLGVYGLRDLAGRERIWQVTHPDLPGTYPPLKAGASSAGNLPAPISSFVGRSAELAALSHAIAGHRLVSIVGEAGAGKSRLAIAAAAATTDSMAGGVWWVAPIEATDLEAGAATLAAVAQTCAIDRAGDDVLSAIATHFRSAADALVVMDGIDVAAADAVAALLSRCPTMRVVTTGRDPLRIAGEVVHSLAPLAVPPESFAGGRAELDEFDAARLFIERATAAGATARFDDAEATTVAHICRVLGGLPLGLELAAARSASTSLAQLVSSLGALAAAPAVGAAGTLASSIAWSYQLLAPHEQTALRRLAVFVGSIEIDAATAVIAGGELDERAAATALEGLLDQRLLTVDDLSGRLVLPAAVRQFAYDRLLAAADRTGVIARHGEWFAGVAERFAAAGEQMPVSLLAPDEADLLLALDVSMHSADPSVAYRIIVGVGVSWAALDHHDALDALTAWVCHRSPSDGEELWAAAVARLCVVHAGTPDAPIHVLTDEARAVAEGVHDDVSPRLLDDAQHSLRAARTVLADMAATT